MTTKPTQLSAVEDADSRPPADSSADVDVHAIDAAKDSPNPTGDAPADESLPADEKQKKSPSIVVTLVLLSGLIVVSLVILVSGLALTAKTGTANEVSSVIVAVGSCLLLWHLFSLITGSGRKTAMISRWPWVNLICLAGFGMITGFSLFDILTGIIALTRMAMVVAGILGIVGSLVSFVRDTDLADRGLHRIKRTTSPAPAPISQEPAPEPMPVLFDPTENIDELKPRGSWPQPRRGTSQDANLWEDDADSAQAELDIGPKPPRRARRAAD